ncbi:hypothetical protein [Rufibacter sp. LB8]|uniref:hypothetical protein n=1 Tax=Rufibacter sp. LB8 TaxID=2777781 RepID=UPI00178C33BF|nr:hypothetical protein [Rufibacter sp. LB8]
MKNVLFICIIFFLGCVTVQAQSKGAAKPSFNDSKEWLDVKFVAFHCKDSKTKGAKKELTEEGITIDATDLYQESIKWADVKNIMIIKAENKVKIIGPSTKKDLKKGLTTEMTGIDLYLCKATYDDLQKIVKALSHAATLKGAKIVADDMF